MYYFTKAASPLGDLTLVSDGQRLTGLYLPNQKYFLAGIATDKLQQTDSLPIFQISRDWLTNYFTGQSRDTKLPPLSLKGSDFRHLVWQELLTIPFGELRTYGEIANEVADKMGRTSMSSQAVGAAISHNPISILVPCHRVISTSNNLTGYAGGIPAKIKLLEIEGHTLSDFKLPKN
ncbi:methylated-DNA--[protein]-cysteine S-methyltransferase [Eupransor demetentiae]|uniref:DNA repair enzyme Ada (O6-methylguanine-DNA--protein-cysteine methyltransferase) (AdaB) n=1 Tax=Eupransor demetentiae TaxID=3109584 RepID=A0ABP0ER42_9LACO|nr:DNA repair enzyme Ada (O6-methylguanine-DNA--protein-cysteine methyltransferase) (AdaB) [Lactobacillaceae bacterium LMG 33000]